MLHFVSYVSDSVRLRHGVVQSAFNLLAEGHTVPFIARYRAARVGNVNAEQLYILQNYYNIFETINKIRSNRIGLNTCHRQIGRTARMTLCRAVHLSSMLLKDLSLKNVLNTHMMGSESTVKF